ncbi:MAG TPA: penicillin-binding transpeptidase domain-containing protein [Acidimicrobiia bacterium]|nr:penicillin-binding transpeptidase domain-containing protein [Acidimicrobiia bacterium]
MKFAIRLTSLGIAFMVMFSIVGLRLWFVQVAEGPAYAQAAAELTWISRNSYAPRGDIFDRNSTLLATSRLVPAVVVDRTFVQPEEREDLIQTLSALLGMEPAALDHLYEEAGINGRFQVTAVSAETSLRINERLDMLPGVEIVNVPERVYLSGDTLAHVIGHLGLPEQSDIDARPDLDPSVRIGKLGVEKVYDEFLEGTPGEVQYRVRSGDIIAERPGREPEAGDSVILTLDFKLQELVERALEEAVGLSNDVKDDLRNAGKEVFNETQRAAAVVLDAKTFEVLSLASYPDFDPQLFVAGLDPDTFANLQTTQAFNNLAIAGQYPPASTFKAITYLVKEEENLPLPEDVEGVDIANQKVHCDGTLFLDDEPGTENKKNDWYAPRNLGWLDIHGAIENSCNIFFWNVALGTHRHFENENVIQEWAQDLGYGGATGIDLSGEASGIVPTRALFEEWKEFQLENPDQPPRLDRSRLEFASPWLGGDLLDLAIGQGAFVATPLQVAVSYASMFNGGLVMEPRVVKETVAPNGDVTPVETSVVREVEISEGIRQALLTDLNRVVTTGTASRAFKDFGPGLELVGGKTGTGESSQNKDDHAWFVAVAPIDDPQFVVVVLVDEGGSGSRIAAPVVRHILQYLMGNEPTPIVEGADAD